MSDNNRTLVKLDDKLIEIVDGEDGLHAKAVTTDELCEITLLDKGVEKFIENDLNKVANEAYDELCAGFKNTLIQNVLKISGFDNHWGRGWEIDHCNGRTSMVTEYLSSKVRRLITEECDKLLEPDIKKMIGQTKKVLLNEFKEEFIHQVKDKMRTQAKQAAQEFLADVMKTQMTKLQVQAIKKAQTAFLGRSSVPNHEDED